MRRLKSLGTALSCAVLVWVGVAALGASAPPVPPLPPGGPPKAPGAREAAVGRCAVGQDLLDKGDLIGAEREFLAALAQAPDLPEAKEGLAQADFIRGCGAEKVGLWGNALVWFLQAEEHAKRAGFEERIGAAWVKVFERGRFSIGLDVRDLTGGAFPASAAFRAMVYAEMLRRAPEGFSVSYAREGQAAYLAAVDLLRLSVSGALARTEPGAIPFQEPRTILNPEFAALRDQFVAAQSELASLRATVGRPCPRCGGAGRLVCSVCRGRPPQPCPVCHGQWQIQCDRCGGTGRASSTTPEDLARKEQEVRELQDKLRFVPPTVKTDVPAQWPFVTEFHTKTGSATASYQLKAAPANALIENGTVEKTRVHEDKTIRNPNPKLGLPADPLELPPDQAAAEAALADAAAEVADKLVAAVFGARLAALNAAAGAFQREGKSAEATEVFVDIARLVEGVNREQAAALLSRLQANLCTHGTPGKPIAAAEGPPAPPKAPVPPVRPPAPPKAPAPPVRPPAPPKAPTPPLPSGPPQMPLPWALPKPPESPPAPPAPPKPLEPPKAPTPEPPPAPPKAPVPPVPPEQTPKAPQPPASLGIRVQELTPQLAEHFRAAGKQGALVAEVAPGSRAERVGLRVGDVILAWGGRAIRTPAEFEEAAGKAGGAGELLILRDGQEMKIGLK